MSYQEHTKALTKALMDTKEYKELRDLKTNMKKDKNFIKKITDLKNTQFSLYQYEIGAKKADSKDIKELNSKIESISKDPNVSTYLKSELDFHNLMFKAFNDISHSIESSLK